MNECEPAPAPDRPVPPGGPNDMAAWFSDLIPALAELALEFRVPNDVLDDEIRALFRDYIRKQAVMLTEACARRMADRAREVGHSLQGTGGTMGFPELSVVGAELGRAAREGAWPRCDHIARRFAQWGVVLAASQESPHA